MNAPAGTIDVHAHYIPDFYRAALAAAGQDRPDGIPALPDWNEHTALHTMDQLGVRTALLSISSPGVHFGDAARAAHLARDVNEEAARLVRAHPGRFGFFASLPLPDIDAALDEARYALDTLGADGIILLTNHRGMYLGDERLEPLYAQVAERNAVIFVHPTSPPGAHLSTLKYAAPLLEFMFETTRTITDLVLSGVLERHPELRVIVPHAGAALPVLADRTDLLAPFLLGPETPTMRKAMKQLHFDLSGAPAKEQLQALLAVADTGHLHYGSDLPFTPSQACPVLLQQLRDSPHLDEEARSGIFAANKTDLFPHLTPTT